MELFQVGSTFTSETKLRTRVSPNHPHCFGEILARVEVKKIRYIYIYIERERERQTDRIGDRIKRVGRKYIYIRLGSSAFVRQLV